jgi:DNA-binding CsgD family transcriptional regulator
MFVAKAGTKRQLPRQVHLSVLSRALSLSTSFLIPAHFKYRRQANTFELQRQCQYPKTISVACGRCAVSNVASQGFSTREREILQLLGQGKTSKEIAVFLTLSITTIASHRRSICRKLGVHSTAELIHYAVARNVHDRALVQIQGKA